VPAGWSRLPHDVSQPASAAKVPFASEQAPPVSFLDVAREENEISIMFRLVILLTKGVLRDTRLRRNLMLWLMLVAMVMLFLGSWLMSDDWARRHFWLYFVYWAVCGWITIRPTSPAPKSAAR